MIPNAVVTPTEKYLYVHIASVSWILLSGFKNLHVLLVFEGVYRHCAWQSVIVVAFLTNDVQSMGVHHESVQERAGRDLRERLAGPQGR